MTAGTCTFMGLAVPLAGESEIVQLTAATDILTITGASAQTGDFLVARNSAGAEKGSLDKDGNLVLAGQVIAGTTVTAYDGGTGNKAISPALTVAKLTKGSAGTDYTLAAPGAGNFQKKLTIVSTGAYAHVVTITGLLGGNTITFSEAVGNNVTLLAISATEWVLIGNKGGTQSQVG